MRHHLLFALFLLTTSCFARTPCDLKVDNSTYRTITIGKVKVVDVDSYKIFDDHLFYATSPIYGTPQVGVVNCKSKKQKIVVSARHFDKAYPRGTDFFRLKNVSKKNGSYVIDYYYAPDVDRQDFEAFEEQKNLRMATVEKRSIR